MSWIALADTIDHMTEYERMAQVIERIVEHKLEQRPLEEIAASAGMSPGHLQKLFTAWVGVSPKQFGRYLSLEYAKELLRDRHSSLATATKAGLSSGGRLHDLFVDVEAMTPGEYADGGRNLTLRHAAFPTPFGSCLAAATGKGIAAILFFDDEAEGIEDLRSRFPNAALVKDDSPFHAPVCDYFATLNPSKKIKLHLAGTNFQLKVWEALLSIPEGGASSYGRIAERIGLPAQSRAVGAAVGANPVGYLIPCHRVLKSTGQISGYRWGVGRKRAMLAHEAARRES